MDGGGIYNHENSNPVLSNCTFSRNLAEENRGGGMHNDSSSPTLTNCMFSRNSTWASGGGMYNSVSNPMLTYCKFSGNLASLGGGMENSGSSPTITHCIFSKNSSIHNGGGMWNREGDITLSNCIFSGNSAAKWGGAIQNERSCPTISNCTFTGNRAVERGGGICNRLGSDGTLRNCILWGNTAPEGPEIALQETSSGSEPSTITVYYSNILGNWQGVYVGAGCTLSWAAGNVDVDPCFADPNNGDYHLKSQAGRWDANEGRWTKDDVTSPCIDGGDMASPIGYEPFPNGGRINMGAYGGTAEASKSYFGEPVCETIIAGDINGDCKVNFLDFRLMALHWLEDNIPLSQVPEFYYYSSNRKIYLDIYTAMITVCFEETVTDPEREAVIKQDPILEAIAYEVSFIHNLVLVEIKAGSTDVDIIEAMRRLEKLPEVRYSTPVFGGPDMQMILTDEFIAKFKQDVTEEQIEAFNALHNVEIVRKLLYSDTYVLRVKDPTNVNMLTTANIYYESPITVFSMPNFIGIGWEPP